MSVIANINSELLNAASALTTSISAFNSKEHEACEISQTVILAAHHFVLQ